MARQGAVRRAGAERDTRHQAPLPAWLGEGRGGLHSRSGAGCRRLTGRCAADHLQTVFQESGINHDGRRSVSKNGVRNTVYCMPIMGASKPLRQAFLILKSDETPTSGLSLPNRQHVASLDLRAWLPARQPRLAVGEALRERTNLALDLDAPGPQLLIPLRHVGCDFG